MKLQESPEDYLETILILSEENSFIMKRKQYYRKDLLK